MTSTANIPAKSSPKDAQVMAAILKDMGVTDYEPCVVNQMLEFSYRYVTDVLDDAKVYSNYAAKKEIDTEDIHLAVQCRMDQSFTTPPPRDLLMEIARHKNGQQLPLIKPYSGPRLPPDRYCLSAPNYKLVSNRKKTHRIQIGLPVNPFGPGHRIQLAPVHKQTGKVQIGTPGQMTVINNNLLFQTHRIQIGLPVNPLGPGHRIQLAPVHKQTGKVQIGTPGQMTVINRPSQVKPIIRVASGMGQGLLSGASLQGTTHTQLMSGPPGTQTLINNPLKRKLDDDYDT